MLRARTFFLLGAVAWLAACAETTGPPVARSPLIRADGQLHQLKWQRTAQPREFAATRNAKLAPSLAAASGPVIMDSNQISFWAYAAKDQAIQINYLASDGSWQPYVGFSVPQGALAQWPDGRPIAQTDSVLITVSVDTASLVVRFEPTGLVFNPQGPAQLSVWYADADPDFDASGAVDSQDAYIEQNLLGMWVQESAADPWNAVTAVQSVPYKLFTANLGHFSDYSVSW